MTTFKKGPNNVTQLSRQNLSYKQPWVQVYTDTVLDSWHVGKYSSATYHITVEFDSNQKETMQVLVVARPEHASYTMFGRTSIQDELITLSASVTTNTMTLIVNPASPEFTGARVIFNALYSETLSPLTLPTVVPSSSTGTAGMPTPSNLYGTFSTISVPNNDAIVASYELDTLAISHGPGINISTDSVTKTLTFTSTVNTFGNITVAGSSTLSPDSLYDTLTLAAGPGITINTVSASNTVNIGLSLPTASNSTLGGVKVDGSTISINNGIISATPISYSLPTASNSTLGGVKVDGSSITISGSGVISAASTAYSLPTASTITLGGVKVDGSSITISGSGVISSTVNTYILPPASNLILGGIKVGTGLSIDGNGILSASSYSLPTASNLILGGIRVGTGLAIDGSGILSTSYSLPTAGVSTLGGIKIGTGLAIDGAGVVSVSSVPSTYTLPSSNTSTLGGVIIPAVGTSGITNTSGTIGLATASNSQLGGVKVSTGLAIDGSGNLTVSLGLSGSVVGTTDTQTLTNKTITTVGSYETRTAISALDVDLSTGSYFTKTLSAGATTFTVSNIPAAGKVGSFMLELTNAGTATITWTLSVAAGGTSVVKWVGGTSPTTSGLTASGRDLLSFYTHDAGATWTGFIVGKDIK